MLPLRFIDRAKFFVERQLIKGAAFQLLVVGAVIGLISMVGGLLAYPAGEGENLGEAFWWAFLRLTDPGYLGDDEGSWLRLVSTLLTVGGYVIFMGTLVAILTRSLIARMSELERGLTPVAYRNHVVILGWNSRTVPLIRELFGATRSMRQHLLGRKGSRLKLVVLGEDMSASHTQMLRDEPSIGRQGARVVLRSGSPLQPDALHRVACLNAAAVIIPGSTHAHNRLVSSDVETLKALMSLEAQASSSHTPHPFVVAEIQDRRKRAIARRAYSGPLEIVAGDATIASLMAQNLLHPGLSSVYNELLSDRRGNEFYLRSGEHFANRNLAEVAALCPGAVVCGRLRWDGERYRAELNAPSTTRVEREDKVVMIAPELEATEPRRASRRLTPVERHARADKNRPVAQLSHQRILVLGWNERLPALVRELGSYRYYRFELDIVSVVPVAEREAAIASYYPEQLQATCRHVEANFMQEGELHDIEPAGYDHVVMVSSDRLSSGEEADARAIVGQHILEEHFARAGRAPHVLLELADPANAILVRDRRGEVLITPMILSHLLGQVALRPELRLVFDELFTEGGAEIVFRAPADYGISAPLPFWKLEALAGERAETALGVYYHAPREGRRLWLNPERDAALDLEPHDQLVVLTDTGINKGASTQD